MLSARLIATIVVSGFAAFADPPLTYYEAAEGKIGSDLRAALHQIIRNHRVVPYSSSNREDTSDALKRLDQDPLNTNNVVGIYSGASEAASTFGLANGWNREHVWPNSYGLDDQEPAYSDLHNLRAEDLNVNSPRGNKLFDVSDLANDRYQMPAHAEARQPIDAKSWV